MAITWSELLKRTAMTNLWLMSSSAMRTIGNSVAYAYYASLGENELTALSFIIIFRDAIMVPSIGAIYILSKIVDKHKNQLDQVLKQAHFIALLFIIPGMILIPFSSLILKVTTSQPQEITDEVKTFTAPYSIALIPTVFLSLMQQFTVGTSKRFVETASNLIGLIFLAGPGYALIKSSGLAGLGLAITFFMRYLLSYVSILSYYKIKQNQYDLFKQENRWTDFFQFSKGIFTGKGFGSFEFARNIWQMGWPISAALANELWRGLFDSFVTVAALPKGDIGANAILLNWRLLIRLVFGVAIQNNTTQMVAKAAHNNNSKYEYMDIRRIVCANLLIAFVPSLVITLIGTVTPLTLSEPFLKGDNVEDVKSAVNDKPVWLTWLGATMLESFANIILGGLRALGKTKIAFALSFIAYWVVGAPLSYGLALKAGLKLMGLSTAHLVSMGFFLLSSSIAWQYESRKILLEKSHASHTIDPESHLPITDSPANGTTCPTDHSFTTTNGHTPSTPRLGCQITAV